MQGKKCFCSTFCFYKLEIECQGKTNVGIVFLAEQYTEICKSDRKNFCWFSSKFSEEYTRKFEKGGGLKINKNQFEQLLDFIQKIVLKKKLFLCFKKTKIFFTDNFFLNRPSTHWQIRSSGSKAILTSMACLVILKL